MQQQRRDPTEKGNGRGGQKELEEQVLKAALCTGCGACVNICPYQTIHHDRTVTLHACDLAQGRCYACCPQTPVDLDDLRRKLYEERDCTPELGAVKGFFIVRAADEGVRQRAQHGGTVTALVALALREGLIDAAVLAGEGEGLLPHSVTITDAEDAAMMCKSRFVVSPTVAEFNRICQGDAAKIGVVVTPCQAVALAKMRTQPVSEVESGIEKLHLVVGLFCGWALSWQKLATLLKTKTDLAQVTGMDIPPSRYHALEVYTPGGTIRISLDEVNPCVREACHSCGDMTAEFSDLSVGSARLPEGWEAARSWNQVIVRTKRGMDLLELARRRGVLEFRDPPAENLEKLKAASLGKKKAAASRSYAQDDSVERIEQAG
ncbi:MAG: Coenzyme F420 hydrogenase/dehydrogenase, beta subunit C-terminal domain [Proteobacteria bacterium]|nr:Coenzyme F420 hydrogenase/dehydrogenase, beta subunit C-terminal domain [Pseudomonadota bacterium]MBU4581703.1 Coenzyme F420 hydrogenase/dehydrogenase, beta subunit C-terminal domain [Pseudomonadota bacterium]